MKSIFYKILQNNGYYFIQINFNQIDKMTIINCAKLILNNFIQTPKIIMRLSHKNSLQNQSITKNYKNPKDLIKKLNQDINTIQTAVDYYNKTFQVSNQLRKQLDLIQGKSCPLKTLSQPKFQNILLQNNFKDNPILLKRNQSFTKRENTISLKRSNYPRKNSIYSYQINKKVNISEKVLQNQKIRQIEKQNPENQQFKKIHRKVSFGQEIGKFDKLVYLSNFQKMNFSQGRIKAKVNSIYPSEITGNDQIINVSYFNDSSTSKLLKSSVIPKYHEAQTLNDSIVIPFAVEKNFNNQESKRLKSSRNLRKKIDQRTQSLKKQWLKTENYKQKMHINNESSQKDFYKKERNKKANKLESILMKVNHRRPTTSRTDRASISSNKRTQTIVSNVNEFQSNNFFDMNQFFKF